jgi:Neocarzinostatin family
MWRRLAARVIRVGGLAAALALSATPWPGVAAGQPAPTITVAPAGGLLSGQQVTVTGTGFSAPNPVPGEIVECNTTPGQPTVGFAQGSLAVGCSPGLAGFGGFGFQGGYPVLPQPDGTLSATLVIATGIIGPPQLGIDSAGHNPAADAANYPCPPTSAQQAAGAVCTVGFQDLNGNAVSTTVTFGTPITTTPTASASPASGLSSGEHITVSGTGFTPRSPVVVAECNVTPGEPTNPLSSLPLGCTNPQLPATNPLVPAPGRGAFPSPPGLPLTSPTGALDTIATVQEGNVGGSLQSASYPCPPSAANVAAGGACKLVVEDAAAERVDVTLDITGPVPVPTIRVSPTGGLHAGSKVAVMGDHFTNSPGAVLECNNTTGQPTIAVSGVQAPVGCTNPFDGVGQVTAASDGTVTLGGFVIKTGTVGPVAPGPDSAGRDAAVDASAYPCPPTAAQQAAGVVCQIVVGTLSGDVARQRIGFATDPPGGPAHPEVALANPVSGGSWATAADGGVYDSGSAPFLGSLPGEHIHPVAPIAGIAATSDGGGFWLVGTDGGVFSFGNARFLGSLPSEHVGPIAPIVGITPTADDRGYWLVGSDGGVFTFGDAAFAGAIPGLAIHYPPPIVALTPTADGTGYWLAGADGNVSSFGTAPLVLN